MRLGLAQCLVAAASLPRPSLCWEDISARADVAVPDALAKAPSCAHNCLAAVWSNPACSNMTCTCADANLDSDAIKCFQAACSLPDALATMNLTEMVCDRPRRDNAPRYEAMNIAVGAATSVIVVARTVFKQFFSYRRALGADDWVILVSLLVGIPCVALNAQGLTAHGLGKDVWTLDAPELTTFMLYFYVLEILYIALMASVKLGLSLFYLAIFPGTTIRRLLWGTAAFSVLFGVSFVVTAIFQCSPVSYYWTQYVRTTTPGTCLNTNMLGWVHGAVNIAIDIWLIAIPLSQVHKLGLHWKKKIGVTIMFLTGAFATIVSILRLQSLILFANSINPTWDNWNVAWWSTIEIATGLICTCLPSMRLILVRLFPRVFSSGGSSYHDVSRTRSGTNHSILVQRQVRVSSMEIPLEDNVAKYSSAKSWEMASTESRCHSTANLQP